MSKPSLCSSTVLLLACLLGACPDEEPAAARCADAGAACAQEAADDSDAGAEEPEADEDAGAKPAKTEPAKNEPAKNEPAKNEPPKSEPPKDAPKSAPDAGGPTITKAPAQGEIETVMMSVKYTLGIGGGVYPQPRPVLLFKDGSATTDINFVVRNLDVPTHKSMFANTWTEWKTVDGKVALKNGMSWTPLDFQIKYPPNAPSLTLDAVFTYLNGATLGETTAFTQKSVRFFPDHKVLWGSVTGVTGPSIVVGSFPPDQRGTYQIDGYTIELKWDDGKTTRSSFVWSDEDPGAVFIAGAGYVDQS